jgi:hypothetical protein
LTLRSNGKKFVFAMDASLVRRCDGGRIDRLFKRSWELFWILWHINPDWVEMQETQILKSA